MSESTDTFRSTRLSVLQMQQHGCSTPKSNISADSFGFEELSDVELPNTDDISCKRKTVLEANESSQLNVSTTSSTSTKLKLMNDTLIFLKNLKIADRNQENSRLLGSSTSVQYGETPVRNRKVHKGQDWKMFKPQNMHRLYNHVLSSSATERQVFGWVQLYRTNENKAISNLMQFVVDVCGFQELDISTIFTPNVGNHMELIHYMQSNPPALQVKTGRYLLNTNTNWSRSAQAAIYNFMQNLIKVCHEENILYLEKLAHLFAFLFALGNSGKRALRHTAVVLAVKMYSTLLNLYSKTSQHQVTSMKKRNVLQQLLLLLREIIESSCTIQDPQLSLMKVICAVELGVWFTIDPTLIVSTKYFNRLMRFVQDQSKAVRIAALETCTTLIDNIPEHLNPVIETFSKVVGDRICDIDYSVAICAVKVCTLLLERYAKIIDEKICNKILAGVFGNQALFAKAAGEFFIEYITIKSGNCVSIMDIVASVHTFEKIDLIPLLVEALLDTYPDISNWQLMIDGMLSDSVEITEDYRKILIYIMSESVQQSVTGICKITRIKSSERPVKVSSATVNEVFIKKIVLLLKKYRTDSHCIKMLVEILLIMDFQEISLTNNASEIDDILSTLRPIFAKQSDSDVLEIISKFLLKLCENSLALKHKYINKIQTIQLAVKDALCNFMEQKNKEEFENWVLRLLSLSMYHDLSEIITVEFLLTSITSMEDNNFSANAIKYTLKSCYHILMKQLGFLIEKVITSSEPEIFQEDLHQLKTICEKFLSRCFAIFRNSQIEKIRFSAVECICDTYLKFNTELAHPIKTNPLLGELIPPVFEPVLTEQFMNYVQKALFDDTPRRTLLARRTLLGNVYNMIHSHVISGVMEAVKLYSYYYSHSQDYGDIFESGLKIMRESGNLIFIGVILQALIYKFTHLVMNAISLPERDQSIINLQNLSKKFQLLLNRSVDDAKCLLKMGIKYATSSEAHYLFLNLIKYFSSRLSLKEKQLLIDLLLSKVPPANHEHQSVKEFVWYLKNSKRPERAAVRSIGSPSTTSVSDTVIIQDESSLSSTANYEIIASPGSTS